MLGIIFTSLVEMLEEKVSPDFADDVLVAANLENEGAFTSVGYYHFSEMQKLVTVLVEKTGKSAEELLYDFGYFLFGKLEEAHSPVLADTPNVIELLAHLDDDIHVQVRKLYPDADLPKFRVLQKTDSAITLEYISQRELVSLAEGLMDAAAARFQNNISREVFPLSAPHSYQFSVAIVET